MRMLILLLMLLTIAACKANDSGEVVVDFAKVRQGIELAESRVSDLALQNKDTDPLLYDRLHQIELNLGGIADAMASGASSGLNSIADAFMVATQPLLAYVNADANKQADVRSIVYGARTAVDVLRILLAPPPQT